MPLALAEIYRALTRKHTLNGHFMPKRYRADFFTPIFLDAAVVDTYEDGVTGMPHVRFRCSASDDYRCDAHAAVAAMRRAARQHASTGPDNKPARRLPFVY